MKADGPNHGRRWKRPLRWVTAVGLLTLLLTQVPVGGVVEVLGGVRPWPVLAAAGLMVAMQGVMAVRLGRLAAVNGVGLTLWRVLEINLTARFYGLLIPGGNLAGSAVRLGRLARAQTHGAGAALALVVDRLLATLTLGAVGLVFYLGVRPVDGGPWLVALLGVTAGGLVLVLPAVAGVRVVPGAVGRRSRGVLGDRLPAGVLGPLRRAASIARQTRRIGSGRLLEAMGWSVLMHVLGAAAYWQLAGALGIELTFAEGGWARTAMLVATLLPITWAGVGLREGAAVVALGALGIAGDVSVAFSLLCFAVTVLGPGFVGGAIEAGRLAGRR